MTDESNKNEVIIDAAIKARSQLMFEIMCDALRERNYLVHTGRLPGGRISKPDRPAFAGVPCVEEVLSSRTKLLIRWWRRGGGWSWDIPNVLLSRGILPDTWLLDTGLLSESMLLDSLPADLEPYFNDECQQWSSNYCRHMINNNHSTRTQPGVCEVNIPGDFVFLPMQYSKDISITVHCSIPYASFVTQVASFCASNDLTLVVKHHPDIQRQIHPWRIREMKQMNSLLKKCRKRGCRVAVMDGSIHSFLQKCKFMAGMNTMSHTDAIVNGCISLHCGGSPFMNSGAVVHDDDVHRGLDRCLNMSAADLDQLRRNQRAMIYYLYHQYLVFPSEMPFPSEHSNIEKVGNFFDRRVV